MAFLEAHQPAIPESERRETMQVERLRQRDSAAWAELFEQHHPMVFRAILAQVGDRAVAEDIAGQVFLEALEGINRYRDRGRPVAGWLLSIARHRSLDWLRRRQRERRAMEHVNSSVETAEPSKTGAVDALQVLAHLTPEQREVVYLRFVEGYSVDDVARLTGRAASAVKSLQHRALHSLRGVLESDHSPEERI